MDAPTRTETDSLGPIEVPAHVLWGAQTARSLKFFAIGEQRMPLPVIHTVARIKEQAAHVNAKLGLLPVERAQAIAQAASEVAQGQWDSEFPLSVWQTGSGTQSHMNVNEVVAQRATQLLAPHSPPISAHDEVNLGQSSNDVFPSAIRIAAATALQQSLLPALQNIHQTLARLSQRFQPHIKIGRTHLQDATPITLGQEFGGYAGQIAHGLRAINAAWLPLCCLPLGGTAVGTGLNSHPDFSAQVIRRLAQILQLPLEPAPNLFTEMAGLEAIVGLHAALRMVALAMIKIGNDIRLMGSGPRAGLGELTLPQNEPGSSIMPGKVNPTQVEALLMVCAQVMGHDAALGFAASQGQFELNVFQPLVALNVLDSLRLLTDALNSFNDHLLQGLQVNEARLHELVQSSLMLVTALTPHIGYKAAAHIAQHAHQHHLTLREAAVALGHVSNEQFDKWVRPENMLGPHSAIKELTP
jgi:fumarate hydratase, class II